MIASLPLPDPYPGHDPPAPHDQKEASTMAIQRKPPVRADASPGPNDPAVRYGKIDAARMLGFSVRTLDYRISQGKLTTTRSGGRVMISRSEILRYGKINDTDPVIAKLPAKDKSPTKAA